MARIFFLALAVCGALLPAQKSQASTVVEKSLVTFRTPVEVPGGVLRPGTYLFQLDANAGDLNVVEIKNPQETKVYGVFLVKPDYRRTAPTGAVVTFDERAPGTPEAIRTWFYPGDKFGNRFIYRK
jgi:hypothetical protein